MLKVCGCKKRKEGNWVNKFNVNVFETCQNKGVGTEIVLKWEIFVFIIVIKSYK